MTRSNGQTDTPIGLTRDAGWQIGVRRTLPHPAAVIWDALVSEAGRAHWIGHGAELPVQLKTAYRTSDGTIGELRSFTEGELIRLTWQPNGWPASSTLQIRLIPATSGTTLSIHQERLDSADRREAMRSHWSDVIDRLEAMIGEASGSA